MPGQEINIVTDSGGNPSGLESVVRDDDGTERAIKLEPDDDGTVDIAGRGPKGSKSGTIDPSGNGSNPLGK